jgi:hypothetical protein
MSIELAQCKAYFVLLFNNQEIKAHKSNKERAEINGPVDACGGGANSTNCRHRTEQPTGGRRRAHHDISIRIRSVRSTASSLPPSSRWKTCAARDKPPPATYAPPLSTQSQKLPHPGTASHRSPPLGLACLARSVDQPSVRRKTKEASSGRSRRAWKATGANGVESDSFILSALHFPLSLQLQVQTEELRKKE